MACDLSAWPNLLLLFRLDEDAEEESATVVSVELEHLQRLGEVAGSARTDSTGEWRPPGESAHEPFRV